MKNKDEPLNDIKWEELVQLSRHQAFTGAVNPGDNCYSVGYLNTTAFVVYGSGTNLVILTSDLDTLQIIPGIKYGNIQVGCVECSSSEGMVAASYAHHIYLFKPKSIDENSIASISDSGKVRWIEVGFFQLESFVTSLSWNPDGSQLLTAAAERIQLWKARSEEDSDWYCAWQYKSPNGITSVKFSPDGSYFATVGKNDSLVKIWYKQLYQLAFTSVDNGGNDGSKHTGNSTAIYNYVYIAHPCAVTGFSWRTTSHLMQTGTVLCYLMTSCRDNKCRIWAETSDSLRRHNISLTLSCNVGGETGGSPHHQMHKHNQSLQRNGNVPSQQDAGRKSEYFTAVGSNFNNHTSAGMHQSLDLVTLEGSRSGTETETDGERGEVEDEGVRDREEQRRQMEMAYGNPSRFHLVSVINPQTDIPSSVGVGTVLNGEVPDSTQFVVHWLNNKHIHFNLQAEIIFRYLHRKFRNQTTAGVRNSNSTASVDEEELKPGADSQGASAANKDSEETAANFIEEGKRALTKIMVSLFEDDGCVDDYVFVCEEERSNEGEVKDGRAQSLKMEPQAFEGFSEVLKKSLPHWLKEWQKSPDMVFSIHPLDGSLLLWKIDSLDEHAAGAYRHPQISFASRIPNAFPASDAISCSNNLLMFRTALSEDVEKFLKLKFEHQMSNPFILTNQNFASGLFAPNMVILSKHSDGSLNQWEVSFDANSQYSSLQTVSHLCRVSGHRFHMVDLKNHPSLPLLLTVSHHNVPKMVITDSYQKGSNTGKPPKYRKGLVTQMSVMESNLDQSVLERPDVITEDLSAPHGLCSELILWRVDPVGPLSQSGGLLELARVQSPRISAFCTASWIPTLLPSHVLGPVSRSPSVSFVAFDGESLRVYQSIIDAQPLLTKLAVLKGSPKRKRSDGVKPIDLSVVSQQSTNQPACIIELNQLENSEFLKNCIIKLFHVFKYEDFVCQKEPEKTSKNQAAFGEFSFDEKFVLVAVAKPLDEEKNKGGWKFYTWLIRIFISDPQPFSFSSSSQSSNTMPNFEDDLMMSPPKSRNSLLSQPIQNLLRVSSTFEGEQNLSLDNENVESAAVADLGHVSKLAASHSPDEDSPSKEDFYQIVTCTDSKKVLFWNCVHKNGLFKWKQWKSIYGKESEPGLVMDSVPINVTCANFGRIALAYKLQEPDSEHLSVRVDILENESSGGSCWVLENTIITPKCKSPNMAYGASVAELRAGTSRGLDSAGFAGQNPKLETLGRISSFYRKTRTHKVSVIGRSSSLAAEEVRRKKGDSDCKIHKVYLDLHESEKRDREFVHVAWVPKYDGSYLLCVCTGDRVIVYSSVSSNVGVNSNTSAMNRLKPNVTSKSKHSRAWVPIAYLNIATSDELSPFPVLMSSVSNGVLILGLMNEMQIFSQWQSKKDNTLTDDGPRPKTESVVSKGSQLSGKSVPQPVPEVARLKGSIQSANASIRGSLSSLSVNSYVIDQRTVGDEKDGRGVSATDSDTSPLSLIDPGIFEQSRALNPVLPQYHPKVLIGLLNFGKMSRVKAILAHLVKTLVGEEAVAKAVIRGDLEEDEQTDAMKNRRATLSRSMTIQNGRCKSVGGADSSVSQNLETISPLPLYTLMEMDSIGTNSGPKTLEQNHPSSSKVDKSGKNSATNSNNHPDKYDALFGASDLSNDFDVALDLNLDFATEDSPKQPAMLSPNPEAIAAALASIGPTYFGPAQSRLLAQCLTKLQLPDLSRSEQMHLLAVAQVVSTLSTETFHAQGSDTSMTTDTIDDCGMRFVMGLKLHQFITKASGMSPLSSSLDPGLFAWAHLSESEDQMIAALRPNSKWADLRNVGVGWWVTNLNTLRTLSERVAREHFQAKKEPMDAAIFYIAMHKKNVLRGLFKSVGDEKMTAFFSRDFSRPEEKRVALKNAFALNSKQRFEHAAAFFLLAGQLEDAVQCCIKKLQDIQLAIVVSRLYEEDLEFSSTAAQILRQNVIKAHSVLPSNKTQIGSNVTSGNVPNDLTNPFFKCIAHWWLKEFSHALCALVDSCKNNSTGNISVFNFYNYLRTHPMIVRRHILKIEQVNDRSVTGQSVLLTHMTGVKDLKGEKMMSLDEISRDERLLFFKTAADHFSSGCPLLALEVLTILPPVREDDFDLNSSLDVNQINKKRELLRSGTIEKVTDTKKLQRADQFDWGPTSVPDTTVNGNHNIDSGMFDWGASVPIANGNGIDFNMDLNLDDVLKIDGEDLDEKDESSTGVAKQNGIDHGKPKKVDATGDLGRHPKTNDLFARYFKQEACLKIFVEELRTLAMAIDCDECHLRAYFRLWLEKIASLLDELSNPLSHHTINDVPDEFPSSGQLEDCLSPPSKEQNNVYQLDVERKLGKALLRKAWLKQNEPLLNFLLGYSSLYGCNGGGLSCVRMELILLLQELQQNYTRKQMVSPLPFPNSLPLISACLAPIQTVVVNPFNSLERSCQDLVKTLTSYTTPPQNDDAVKIAITLRNLCGSLSSCIYQSLQDSDKVSMNAKKLQRNLSTDPDSSQTVADDLKSSKIGELFARNYTEGVSYKNSILVTSRRKRTESNSSGSPIISRPSDWPGVKLFIRLLSDYAHLRSFGSESRLRILLVESCCVVYTGILFHALVTNDANELLRVVANPISSEMFALIAGGCVRTRSHNANVLLPPQDVVNLKRNSNASARAESAAHVAANKHRINLNSRLLSNGSSTSGMETGNGPPSPVILNEEQKYQFEKFASPATTIFDYILNKPALPSTIDFLAYDSEDEAGLGNGAANEEDGFFSDGDSDDGYGFRSNPNGKPFNVPLGEIEHSDPNSYSWCIMRFAIITHVLDVMNTFILEMGLELAELALHSPTLQNLRNTVTQWQNVAHTQLSLLASNGAPDNFIPVTTMDTRSTNVGGSGLDEGGHAGSVGGSFAAVKSARPTANDLFHPDATPFKANDVAVLPVKRLWCYLVRQKRLENLFFHYCFAKGGEHAPHANQLTIPSRGAVRDPNLIELPVNPVAVVYRDPSNETINALCFNNIPLTLSHSIHCLVVATPKDITENDITNIVCPPAPSSGNTLAMLGKNLARSKQLCPDLNEFEMSKPAMNSNYGTSAGLFSHRKGNYMKRNYATNVRKLCSHPFLPFYLSGCSNGKLNLWEWGLDEVVAMFKTTNSKITALSFNSDGRKLGASEETGKLHLYHTSFGGIQQTAHKPFMSLECHAKQCAGFSFVGSSSLVATAGTGLGVSSTTTSTFGSSSGGTQNCICLWDCLMPANRGRNLISVYNGTSASSDGYFSLTYSSSTHSVVAGTGRGEILLFDTRQRKLQATLPAFTATQSQVKCLALDPLGNLLAAGSRDGDIKVFDLISSNVIFSTEGEHKRKDGLFKTGPRGVLDVQILSSGDHLLSCGSDGSVKLRKLTNCATPLTQYLL